MINIRGFIFGEKKCAEYKNSKNLLNIRINIWLNFRL